MSMIDQPVVGVCGEDDVAGEDDDQLGEGEVHQQPVDRGSELQKKLQLHSWQVRRAPSGNFAPTV